MKIYLDTEEGITDIVINLSVEEAAKQIEKSQMPEVDADFINYYFRSGNWNHQEELKDVASLLKLDAVKSMKNLIDAFEKL